PARVFICVHLCPICGKFSSSFSIKSAQPQAAPTLGPFPTSFRSAPSPERSVPNMEHWWNIRGRPWNRDGPRRTSFFTFCRTPTYRNSPDPSAPPPFRPLFHHAAPRSNGAATACRRVAAAYGRVADVAPTRLQTRHFPTLAPRPLPLAPAFLTCLPQSH